MRKLRQASSSRNDLAVYGLLLVGSMFVYAGLVVDPAGNCDSSGTECAPWLVPIAFVAGMAFAGSALMMLLYPHRWGSRLDLEARTLWWWDSAVSRDDHAIALDQVACIQVQRIEERADRVFLHGRDGEPIRFPPERSVPYAAARWAQDVAMHFPHIRVDLVGF